jgi:hypothetical protein
MSAFQYCPSCWLRCSSREIDLLRRTVACSVLPGWSVSCRVLDLQHFTLLCSPTSKSLDQISPPNPLSTFPQHYPDSNNPVFAHLADLPSHFSPSPKFPSSATGRVSKPTVVGQPWSYFLTLGTPHPHLPSASARLTSYRYGIQTRQTSSHQAAIMPAVDTEGQFKFLLCCIKHSAAGKVSLLKLHPAPPSNPLT